MTNPRFIHLKVHSDYSIMYGIAKVKSLVKRAVDLNMPALAITDFTNLFSLIKFYRIAHSSGIKPIIGAHFNIKNESFINEKTQITILAMNNIGYKNLTLLISRAYKQGYSISGPWIDRKWLIEFNDGLLLISGGRMGDIGKFLLKKNNILLNKSLDFYNKYFPGRFYLELIRTGRYNEENYLCKALRLAEEHRLPVVATNDVYFINSSDFYAHEIRVAIQSGSILDDLKSPQRYSSQQYMRSEEEMCRLFADIPEALKNSVEIAKRCNVHLRLGEYFLPKFSTGNMTAEDFLIKKSKEGLKERLSFLFSDKKKNERYILEYNKRLDLELKIINQMGFPGYFLIVMEFVQWSKDNDIPVGPGRGSGAGSLVAYALKITEIDPLQFDLLFERFLNPERISMPDFDIDFCMEKRDQVIEHMANRYGRNSVSQIITFGTMTAKSVIRDVGRVLGYQYNFVDQISKLIPSDPGITLNQALEIEPQLLKKYNTDEAVKLLINMSLKLEGVIRNISKHAGGVVISPTEITDFSPIYCDELGKNPVTHFDKNDIECIGLVKFDFLGLRTLTVINLSLEMINKNRIKNHKIPLNINSILLDDKKSFEILQRSETTAVFQLESLGMKDLIKRLKPDCFEDIIALIALFRPGPLQSGMVDNFINRKHGLEKISYPDLKWQHNSLESILKSTYGIILYQEQVMQIAQVLSGYTLADADILRRAMGKKKPEEMIKQRSVFTDKAKKNGVDGKLAIKIFDIMEKFSGYGFNKSHSVAYALVSYQTLWLKAHYPAEFISAVMTSDMDDTKKIIELVDECWRIGLKVLPPDINFSAYNFQVNEDGDIVYGMGAIKGIGKNQIENIISIRENTGHFLSFFDFCIRIGTKKLNRRMLEKLIISGAFDKLGYHRAAMINSLEDILKAASQYTKDKITGQIDMFGNLSKLPKQIEQSFHKYKPWSEQLILHGEKESLGLYLTGHPINQYLKEIEIYIGGYKIKDIKMIKCDKLIKVAGLITNIKFMTTKNGNNIGICILDDRSGNLEVIFYNEIIVKYRHLLKKDQIIIINGRLASNSFSNKLKMIANTVISIDEARQKYVRELNISLNDEQINEKFLMKLHRLLEPYLSGPIPVHLYYNESDVYTRFCFEQKWNIFLKDNLLKDLRNFIGSEQIKLKFK